MRHSLETLGYTVADHYGKILLGLAGFGAFAALSAFTSYAKTAING